MAYPTDQQVRAGIKAILALAAPLAVVDTRWILGDVPENDWPASFISDLDGGRVHGYVIYRTEIRSRIKSSVGAIPIWQYEFFGMRFYETGSESANSEMSFMAELDAITATFYANRNVGQAQQIDAEPLSIRTDQKNFGGKLHHVCLGTVTVEPCNV